MVKSNSLILKKSSDIFNNNDKFNIIHEQQINNFFSSKSKSLKVKKIINPNIHHFLSNNEEGHLETVLETISEVSNSRKESKILSKNDENIQKIINNNDEY